MATVEGAIATAATLHGKQKDLEGEHYIFHPLRVMEGVRMGGYDEKYQIAAVLHDVMEDTDVHVEFLHEYVGDEIFEALEHLTRQDGETYNDYLDRCMQNEIAKTVKKYDAGDNYARSFRSYPRLAKRYKKALEKLNGESWIRV